MQPFNHLKIWQRSHALSITIRKLTQRRSFRGYADVRGQINRSSSSVPWNISEGCGADSKADFAKFLDVSIKSLNEVESQLTTCADLDLIPREICTRLTAETIEIRKMTHAYRVKVLRTRREEGEE